MKQNYLFLILAQISAIISCDDNRAEFRSERVEFGEDSAQVINETPVVVSEVTNETNIDEPSPEPLNTSPTPTNSPSVYAEPTPTPSEQVESSPTPSPSPTPVVQEEPQILYDPSSFLATESQIDALRLEWTAPITGIPAVAFRISYYKSQNAPLSCSHGNLIGSEILGNSTSILVPGLDSGSSYSFRLCSVAESGDVSSGVTILANTLDLPPREVESFTMTQPVNGVGTLQLSWVGGADTTSYRVAYFTNSTVPPSNCFEGNSQVVAGNSVTLSQLSLNQSISARVCGLNRNHPPQASTGLSGSRFVHTNSANEVSGLVVARNYTHSMDLRWNSSGDNASGYRIAMSTAATPVSCDEGVFYNTSSTEMTLTQLEPLTTYYFRACAVNNDQMPLVTTGVTAQFTTLPLPIAPVSNLRCPNIGSNFVTWSAHTTGQYYGAVRPIASPPTSCNQAGVGSHLTVPQMPIPLSNTYVIKVCAYDPTHPDRYSAVASITCVMQ